MKPLIRNRTQPKPPNAPEEVEQDVEAPEEEDASEVAQLAGYKTGILRLQHPVIDTEQDDGHEYGRMSQFLDWQAAASGHFHAGLHESSLNTGFHRYPYQYLKCISRAKYRLLLLGVRTCCEQMNCTSPPGAIL